MSSDIVIYGECLSILASHMWQMAADGKLGDGTLLSIGTAVDYHPAQDDALDTLIRWLYARLKALSEQAHASVNIALLHGSHPVLGVEAVSVDAVKGQGAFVQRRGQEAKQLHCAEVDLSQSGLVVVASASHLTPETQEFVAQLQAPTFHPCVPTPAAAHAIVEDLGGCVLQAGLFDSKGKLLEDWKAKNILMQYNKENMLNPHFVVY
ncbi:hypothetical protein ACK3TF_003065 [Chlorella vulgaris]